MIRLILIVIIFAGLAGSVYWKLAPKPTNLNEKINALENTIASMRGDVVNLKAKESPKPAPASNYEARIKALEDEVARLKNQKLSVQTSNKAPLYIPLGSAGSAGDQDWYSLPGFEVSIDPADYSGYSSMQVEVTFRMTEMVGTGYARLFNQTDNSAIGEEISKTSDSFSLAVSKNFTLPAGRKTYRLQIKSTYGRTLEIQSARIKVSF